MGSTIELLDGVDTTNELLDIGPTNKLGQGTELVNAGPTIELLDVGTTIELLNVD